MLPDLDLFKCYLQSQITDYIGLLALTVMLHVLELLSPSISEMVGMT